MRLSIVIHVLLSYLPSYSFFDIIQLKVGCQNVFVIKKASNKKYYFVIKTEENEVIASSKTYYYKSSVLEIIESIKSNMDQKAIIVDTTFNWG